LINEQQTRIAAFFSLIIFQLQLDVMLEKKERMREVKKKYNFSEQKRSNNRSI
jgi:hypothetical protein